MVDLRRAARDQSKVQESPITAFLRAGRASHPDEGEVQAEYDLMLGAARSGRDIGAAIRMARSHLVAHRNALRPEMRGTVRDPFPGRPERNRQAVAGFERVIGFLQKRQELTKRRDVAEQRLQPVK